MKFTEIFKDKGGLLRKMWINQFAFSLFGIFVASPFNGKMCVVAGVFSYLFYLSVIGFTVLDDAQKDKISFNAQRKNNVNALTGFKYSFVAFLPTILLMVVYTIFTFIPAIDSSVTFIISIITRFIMGGEILGIDAGLTNYTYSEATKMMVSTASESVIFFSSHGFIHLIYSIVSPLLFGVVYALGFKGIISVNTTESNKKDF